MNITETFQTYVHEPTNDDGRWLFVDASPTELLINVTARTVLCGVTELRTLRAICDHLLTAEEVTEDSTLAAIAAEFEE